MEPLCDYPYAELSPPPPLSTSPPTEIESLLAGAGSAEAREGLEKWLSADGDGEGV